MRDRHRSKTNGLRNMKIIYYKYYLRYIIHLFDVRLTYMLKNMNVKPDDADFFFLNRDCRQTDDSENKINILSLVRRRGTKQTRGSSVLLRHLFAR